MIMNIFITGASGFIGGSIAVKLAQLGHTVRGLDRNAERAADLKGIGIEPVVGSLDDRALLADQARWADAVINAANSDHRGAVEALIEGLEGTGKVLVHTSGSSIVGDASGGVFSDKIYSEDTLPEPTADKAKRVAIDRLVQDAGTRGIASSVLCNTLIYGHGLGLGRDSVQLPRLVTSGPEPTFGPTCTSKTSSIFTCGFSIRSPAAASTSSKRAKLRSRTWAKPSPKRSISASRKAGPWKKRSKSGATNTLRMRSAPTVACVGKGHEPSSDGPPSTRPSRSGS